MNGFSLHDALPRHAAVVGAGLSGAACAQALRAAGWQVRVFDKSRGVGGRMATRRAAWQDPAGAAHQAAFDHGAPAFTARSAAFSRFVDEAVEDGVLARWSPVMAPQGHGNLDGLAHWVAVPGMPALCRRLLDGTPVRLERAVDALRREGTRWRVEAAGEVLGEGFDAVVLALPPAQAAPLLQPHVPAWAHRAQRQPMLPCWTLMAVLRPHPGGAPGWDAAWPQHGPLSWIARNGSKPGRDDGAFECWVAQATAEWSRTHLEQPAAEVQSLLLQALSQALMRPLGERDVAHATVHRWRYAHAPRGEAVAPQRCWWDADAGLAVCGDWLGGAGVEGAWTSGRALAQAIAGPG